MIIIDVETRSLADIVANGVHVYAQEASIMCAVWLDDETDEITEWRIGDPVPTEALQDKHLCAHNSPFEEAILKSVWDITASEWSDTMAMAAIKNLPLSLEKCGNALKLTNGKDMEGSKLMKKICIPIKGTSSFHDYSKDDMDGLVSYCRRDVEVTRDIYNLLPPLPPAEHEQYQLHLKINNAGIPIDYDLIDAAVECADLISASVCAKTGRDAGFFRSSAKLVAWLNAKGVPGNTITKDDVDRMLKGTDDPEVREILLARKQIGQTSIKKFLKMRGCACTDGRVRGTLFFHAACTGRWGGRLFQVQNLPRPTCDTEIALPMVMARDVAGLEKLTDGDPMAGVASCIRSAIRGDFICADWSNIEGRLAAWFANSEWKMQAFRDYDEGTGPDLYKLAYSKSFHKPIDEVTYEDRQVGKVEELALQYGGSNGAFGAMASVYGVHLDKHDEDDCISGWRLANQDIVKYWHVLNNAAEECVKQKTQGLTFKAGAVVMQMVGDDLVMRLPCGRKIYYTGAMYNHSDNWRERGITYMRVAPNRRYIRVGTWYGKLFENVVQASAASLLRFALINLDKAGYKSLFHVHDEVLCEGKGEEALEDMIDVMCQLPEWAKGLPLSAAGWHGSRFQK